MRIAGEACPHCGFLPKRPPQAIVFRDGDLAARRPARRRSRNETSPTRANVRWHGMLAYIASERGYKPGWVAHKFKEKFGTLAAGAPSRRSSRPPKCCPGCAAATSPTPRRERRRHHESRAEDGGRRSPVSSRHAIDMLRSPAWRVLSLSARRVLDRLEIELADHGGVDNGKLPVTYEDFMRYGIDRHAVAPAIREAWRWASSRSQRPAVPAMPSFAEPNLFRLTYRHTKTARPTSGSGSARTRPQRSPAPPAATRSTSRRSSSPACRPSKPTSTTTSAPAAKTEIRWGKTPRFDGGNPHPKPEIHSGETHTTAHSSETPTTLDISGRGSDDNNAAAADPPFACSRSAPHSAVASEHAKRTPTDLNGHSKPIATTQLIKILRARGWVPPEKIRKPGAGTMNGLAAFTVQWRRHRRPPIAECQLSILKGRPASAETVLHRVCARKSR